MLTVVLLQRWVSWRHMIAGQYFVIIIQSNWPLLLWCSIGLFYSFSWKIFGIFLVEFSLLEFYFQSPFLQTLQICLMWLSGGLCLSNSFNWVLFFLMAISFAWFSFISLLISWGRTCNLYHFSLACSVILGFSSVLVLVLYSHDHD